MQVQQTENLRNQPLKLFLTEKVATLLGTDLVALTINADDASELQHYGAENSNRSQ